MFKCHVTPELEKAEPALASEEVSVLDRAFRKLS